MPVRFTLNSLAKADRAYETGPEWAEADIAHAAWCIRRLLDPAAVGQRVEQRLRAIAAFHPGLPG